MPFFSIGRYSVTPFGELTIEVLCCSMKKPLNGEAFKGFSIGQQRWHGNGVISPLQNLRQLLLDHWHQPVAPRQHPLVRHLQYLDQHTFLGWRLGMQH